MAVACLIAESSAVASKVRRYGKAAVIDVSKARGFYYVPDTVRTIIKARVEPGLKPRPEPLVFSNSIFDTGVVNRE